MWMACNRRSTLTEKRMYEKKKKKNVCKNRAEKSVSVSSEAVHSIRNEALSVDVFAHF